MHIRLCLIFLTYYLLISCSAAAEDTGIDTIPLPIPQRPMLSITPSDRSNILSWEIDEFTTSLIIYWSQFPINDRALSEPNIFRIDNPNEIHIHDRLETATYYYVAVASNTGGSSLRSIEIMATPFNSNLLSDSWIRYYSVDGRGIGSDIDIDNNGSIYVSGSVSTTYQDGIIKKYNSVGADDWEQIISSERLDSANSVAVDDAGNVYVGGSTLGDVANSGLNPPNGDGSGVITFLQYMFVVKFDTNGQRLWSLQFDSPISAVTRIAVYDINSIIIVGRTNSTFDSKIPQGENAAFVAKLNSIDGQIIWSYLIDSSKLEIATCVEVGPFGDIIVGGFTDGDLAGIGKAETDTDRDAFLAKLSGAGELRWIKQLASTGALDDVIIDADLDVNGFIYFTGTTDGAFSGVNLTPDSLTPFSDVFIGKYDNSKIDPALIRLIHVDINKTDRAGGIAVKDDGTVYIGGQTFGSDAQGDIFAAHYDNSLLDLLGPVQQWLISGNDFIAGVELDPLGNLYLGGHVNGDLLSDGSLVSGQNAFVLKITLPVF